jgi:transcriptional regulator with XRE-family HTH domain
MSDPSQRNRPEAPAARLAVKEFCTEALRRAGGAAELATVLVELGCARGGEEYHPRTFAQWTSGRRVPSAAILVALAIRFRIPLDGIISAAEETEVAAERLRAARALTLIPEERSA